MILFSFYFRILAGTRYPTASLAVIFTFFVIINQFVKSSNHFQRKFSTTFPGHFNASFQLRFQNIHLHFHLIFISDGTIEHNMIPRYESPKL